MKIRLFSGVIAVSLLAASSAFALDPGDLIINEVMPNPAAVSDTVGEWVEVYNPTLSDIDMIGLELQDNVGSHFVASSTIVPAQGYAVLGRNDDFSINGGVNVDYEYSGLFLANSGDEFRILDGATVVSEMSYGSSISGRSRALDCVFLPTVSANYSSTPTSVTYGDGDAGTPGAYNQWEPDFDGDGAGDSCDPCLAYSDDFGDDGFCGPVGPGDIIVNEVQPDPTIVSDSDGEWFEVLNTTGGALDLAGLEITDGEGSHIIYANVVVPAGGIALLAVSDPLVAPGGPYAVDYQYPYCTPVNCDGMALANGGDSVTILNNGNVIDSLAWSEPPNNRGLSYQVLCDGSVVLADNESPGQPNGADSDGDGIADLCDPCPNDPDNDADGDGLCADEDLCPGTVADDPSKGLNPNHWALFDVAGGEFETVRRGRGNGPGLSFTTADTQGCSCFQIATALGAGNGHFFHGCSNSLMLEWTGQ